MQQLVVMESVDESVPSLKAWLDAKEDRASVETVLQFTEFGARMAASDVLFKSVEGNEWRGLVPPEEFSLQRESYSPMVRK